MMDAQSAHARMAHVAAELRVLFPRITDCHTALVQWREDELTRWSLHLDIRWPQHQTLLSGPSCDSAEAAIEAAFRKAKEGLDGR
jgi:hypothetical protein